MTDAPSRFHLLLVPLLLLAAYLPALQGEFLMSDVRVVVDNARLTSLHGLWSIWSPAPSDVYAPLDQYQPLTYTLWWIERHLFGLDPRWYQIVSISLHALNSLLVWGLLARIGARGAFVAAMIFALHPIQVESVAWIYEQKNPLSGLFFFSTLHAYLEFERRRRPGWYVLALLLFALALLSKASTVLLPAVILLHVWLRREPPSLRSVLPIAPFFVLGAVMAGFTIWYETAVTGAAGEVYAAGMLERVARAGWLTGFGAGKVLIPSGLAFFYPLSSVDPSSVSAWLPNVAILAGLAVLWRRRKSWGRPALLGVGWYLALLFPVMGFFDIYYHRFSLLADHFQYLPSVGLIALLTHAGVAALGRAGLSQSPPRIAARIAALLVIAAFWLPTWQRSHVFASDYLLARDSAEKYPTSWIAFQKSGEYLLRRAEAGGVDGAASLSQAVADLERAEALRPDDPQVQDSLGVAYLLSGRPSDARRHMEKAVAIDPANPNHHLNLAAVYEQLDETERALAAFRAMAAAAPERPDLRFELARALVRAERFHEAVGALDTAAEHAARLAAREPRQAEVLRQARQLEKQVRARLAAESSGLAPAPRSGPRWNVLLLTVDTLRPDYLSFNGHDRPTSPALDALLGEGLYFEQALTPVPRTTPALASLLTGAYPRVTGVRSLADKLPAEMVTLAEAFRAAGYQTLAVVTNLMLGPVRGLGAGFDIYDAAFDARDARHTTDAALRHLEALDPAAPLFAWVHYIDPHVPYHPDPEIAARFDPGYEGRFLEGFGRQPRVGEPPDLFRQFPEDLRKSHVTHRNPLLSEENAHIRRLYAGDIRMTDRQIERLIEAVRARFPRTVIVFTADHGESLGEHDFYFDHGDYVYNASSRVPLAFVLPSEHPWYARGRRDGWVSLVDVAPTLLEVVGVPAPPEMAVLFEGRSLAPSLRGEPLPPAPVFAESGTSFSPELVRRRQRNDVAGRFRAVTLANWKLVFTPFLPDSEAWELYDLATDPDETRDVYRPDHVQAARLRPHLEAWLAQESTSPEPPGTLSDEDRDALHRLGYLE